MNSVELHEKARQLYEQDLTNGVVTRPWNRLGPEAQYEYHCKVLGVPVRHHADGTVCFAPDDCRYEAPPNR